MNNFNKLNNPIDEGINKNKDNIKEVECLSCHKIVEVELIPFGTRGGHITSCPSCGKLAYNGE